MRSLRFFLCLLAVKLILAKPIITSLTGCKRLNSTALDHCKENDIIYINGQNIQFNGIPQIKLSSLDGMDIWSCSYENDLIQCVVPSFVSTGDWRSVSVRLNDEWSDDVFPGVYVAPLTAPVIRSLQGCNQLNSSALDACTTCGSFHLKVDAIKGDAIPSVQIQSNTGITSFPCFFEDSTHTAIECVLPNNNNLMQDDWWTVAVRTNGDWSNIISPGIHILDNQNGPNAAQIYSACPDTGCVGGEYMTIWGTNLIDNNTDATVFISQDFFNSPTYPSFVCPIDFSFSTATLMYCMLPSIPMSSRGIPLQVTVVNAWGAGTITGPLIYSLPVSSSSSSTGGWIPPPTPPPMPASSSSGSMFIGWLVPSVVVFAIVLSAIVCVSRRSARRRAMLLSSNQAITVHQPLYTPQPIHQPINQPVYQPQNQYPGASVPTQQYYYPVVHNYQSTNQPSMNYQQPAYQYYPNQPSAPSAYPQVYRQ